MVTVLRAVVDPILIPWHPRRHPPLCRVLPVTTAILIITATATATGPPLASYRITTV